MSHNSLYDVVVAGGAVRRRGRGFQNSGKFTTKLGRPSYLPWSQEEMIVLLPRNRHMIESKTRIPTLERHDVSVPLFLLPRISSAPTSILSQP
jgi:hypothetical protein